MFLFDEVSPFFFRYLQSRKINAKKDCVVGLTAGLTRIFFCCGRGTGTYLIPIYFVTKVNRNFKAKTHLQGKKLKGF